MEKGDEVYWARIRDNVNEYDVIDLKLRTVESDWFVGTEERTKQSFFFNMRDYDNIVFSNRHDALEVVMAAEKSN